jgi:hypothetical protein
VRVRLPQLLFRELEARFGAERDDLAECHIGPVRFDLFDQLRPFASGPDEIKR